MSMIKKLILGASSSLAVAIAPLVSLTSCGEETKTNSIEGFAFKQLHEVVSPHEYLRVNNLYTANKIYFDDVKEQNIIFIQDLVLSFNDNGNIFDNDESRFPGNCFLRQAYYFRAELLKYNPEGKRFSIKMDVKYRPSIFSTEDEDCEAIVFIRNMPYSSMGADSQRGWAGASQHLMIMPKYMADNYGAPSFEEFAADRKGRFDITFKKNSDGKTISSEHFNYLTISDPLGSNGDDFQSKYVYPFLEFDSYYSMFIQEKYPQ